ncbi:MAG: multidrug transporter [Rhizobacter sp.]|nr:multidrug transporter [Chlorobiales bacterium]
MHTGNHYKLTEFLFWTRGEIFALLITATVPTVLYRLLDWKWLAIPWVPIAMIGTAAAFIVGFRNTQTYNRVWEARQVYGAIVNASRAWGMMVKDFVAANPEATQTQVHQQLIYRHFAWLTAMRFQLRESRTWENVDKSYNKAYRRSHAFTIPERETTLADELKKYLSETDLTYVLGKKNRATHLISLQSSHLRQLKSQGIIDPFNYLQMENVLVGLYEQQGKCERIKNFPYPRQFASLNLFFIRMFVFIVPFGLLGEFHKLGDEFVWLNIPFSVMVTWVFTSMERIGENTENPFEGGSNDVPISALSRTIEIDLREMMDEKDVPPALQPVGQILM